MQVDGEDEDVNVGDIKKTFKARARAARKRRAEASSGSGSGEGSEGGDGEGGSSGSESGSEGEVRPAKRARGDDGGRARRVVDEDE